MPKLHGGNRRCREKRMRLKHDEFSSQGRHTRGVAAAPTIVNQEIFALGPAEFSKPCSERCYVGLCYWVAFSLRQQHADAAHLLGLLRARRERPPAAAPPSSVMNSRRSHSITSSARASNVGGTVEAERLRGLEVDDKLELGRLQKWQICGFGAAEDAADIDARLIVLVQSAGAVTHQAAGTGKFAPAVDCRYGMARSKRSKNVASVGEQCIV